MLQHLRRPLLAGLLIGAAVASCAAPQVDPAGGKPRLPTHVQRARRARAAGPPRHTRVIAPEDPPDPEAIRLFQARLARPAVALGTTPPAPKVTAIALQETERGETDGMKELGAVQSARLAEGERAMMPVTVDPGECVTFVAQGGLGVAEVDLFLMAGAGAGARLLAEDRGAGPIAILGGQDECFRNKARAAIVAELNVTVRRGSGVVLVHGFRK